jgi:hypothetical protein
LRQNDVVKLPALVLLVISAAAAQQPAKAPDFSWLTGSWRADSSRGLCEETWSAPAPDGGLVGMFRLTRNGVALLYQLLIIETDRQQPVLFMRHFKRTLKSIDSESLVFAITRNDDGEIVFEGATTEGVKTTLSYRRVSEDTIVVEVVQPDRNETLRYRRQK